MRFYGKRKAAGAKRYRRVARKARKGGRFGAIAKVVKKVLSNQLERKAWFYSSANSDIYTANTTRVPVSTGLIPQIVQGTGKSQRIGNQIKVTKAFIKGHVNLKPYDATANPGLLPVFVKFYLVSYKLNNQPDITNPIAFNTFFDANNSAVNFQGNMLDMDLTVNKDAWTLHKTKTVKLGASSIYTSGTLVANGYYDNSPMSAPFYFSYTKHCKNIKYDDTVNNICTNRNLFLFYQVVTADGTTVTATDRKPAEIHQSIRVEYTDA